MCPDNVSSVSICILYCRFGSSPLAWGFFGSGSSQVAKFKACLSVFIQLSVTDGREACDKAGLVPLGCFGYKHKGTGVDVHADRHWLCLVIVT